MDGPEAGEVVGDLDGAVVWGEDVEEDGDGAVSDGDGALEVVEFLDAGAALRGRPGWYSRRSLRPHLNQGEAVASRKSQEWNDTGASAMSRRWNLSEDLWRLRGGARRFAGRLPPNSLLN